MFYLSPGAKEFSEFFPSTSNKGFKISVTHISLLSQTSTSGNDVESALFSSQTSITTETQTKTTV